MPKKSCVAAIIMTLFLSLLVTGCSSKPNTGVITPVAGERYKSLKVFRVNLPSNPSTLDPAQAYTESELLVVRALYDTLVDLRDGEVKPALAESWTYSEGGRVLTIKLREGLKFSNGKALTAADVEFSLERVLDGGAASPYAPLLTAFIGGRETVTSSIQAVGQSTLSIRFPAPRRDFIELLAHPCFSVVSMEGVQEKIQTGRGNYFSGTAFPVSGPFKMVEWINNRSITLEANDKYYHKPAQVDRLELFVDRSKDITMYDFGAHYLDMVYLQTADLQKMSLEYPHLFEQFDFGSRSVKYFLSLNPQTQLFRNIEARQAVVSALDLTRLMEASEIFDISQGPLSPLSPEKGLYTGNPKMLFDSYASAEASQVVTLSYPSGEVSKFIAESLKNQLENSLGITVSLKAAVFPRPYLYDQSAHLSLVRWVEPSSAKSSFFSYFYGQGPNPFTNGTFVGDAGLGYFNQAGSSETADQREKYYSLMAEQLAKEFLVYSLVDVKTMYALQEDTVIPVGLEDILEVYKKDTGS